MWELLLRAELGQQDEVQRRLNTHKYQIMSENNKVVVCLPLIVSRDSCWANVQHNTTSAQIIRTLVEIVKLIGIQ